MANNRIKQIARGDMEALKELYEVYKIPVYRLAFSMIKNRDSAEDITQDTFLKIQEKAGNYYHNTSEAAWIFTITRNLTHDLMRKHKAEPLEDTKLQQIPSSEGNPENGDYVFLDLIAGLSKDDAEVVSLRILAGLSFKEIGKITHATAGACGKRYARALDKLRTEMNVKRPY